MSLDDAGPCYYGVVVRLHYEEVVFVLLCFSTFSQLNKKPH